jgi:hypothetical protein
MSIIDHGGGKGKLRGGLEFRLSAWSPEAVVPRMASNQPLSGIFHFFDSIRTAEEIE